MLHHLLVILDPLQDSMKKWVEKNNSSLWNSAGRFANRLKIWTEWGKFSFSSVSAWMPKGYTNAVIIHEKSSGSIGYLDSLISGDYSNFETTYFSVFGVAATKIPTFVESTPGITISLGSLVYYEEVTTVISSYLSSLLDDEESDTDSSISSSISSSSSSANTCSSGTNFAQRVATCVIENDFLIIFVIALIFSIWISITVKINSNKNA